MDLTAETDENLMMRFGRGEVAAFEVLYARHESRVFRYLLRQLRDQASADDAMQDVWFAVARNAQRYQPQAKFTTWLFTLAHNRMIDLMLSRSNDIPVSRICTTISNNAKPPSWLGRGTPSLPSRWPGAEIRTGRRTRARSLHEM